MANEKKDFKKVTDFSSEQVSAFLSNKIAEATNEAVKGMSLLKQESLRMAKVLVEQKQGNLFEIIETTKFNIEAATKDSSVRAVTTAGMGKPHSAADILIQNGNKTVREVQAKSSNKASRALYEMSREKYHGMQKLFNSDKVNRAKELAQKRADTGTLKATEYQDTVKNATGELKHGNIKSGGTTNEEAVKAAQSPEKFARNMEIEQFKREIGISTVNAAVTGGVISGSLSIISNALKMKKGEIDGNQLAQNVAKDATTSSVKCGATGAVGSGIRIVAQKTGKFALSKTNVATAVASGIIESGVTIFKYIKGEIDEAETVSTLGENGISTMSSIYTGAAAGAFFGPVGALVGSVAGYLVASNVYKASVDIFRKAELRKKELRKLVQIYDEAINTMIVQREKMELYFKTRRSNNKTVFDAFFENFETALINQDHNLYIENMSNMAIYLGKEIKYMNFEEFDKVMSSDDPLVL